MDRSLSRGWARLSAPVYPAAGILTLALAATLLDTRQTHWGLVAAAAGLAVAVVVLAGFAPWSRLPQLAQVSLPLACDGVIALLRQAQGGSTSGYAPLAVLPVLWVGLRLGRRAGAVIVAGTCLMLALPIALIGAPMYPDTGWRGTALWTVVASFVVGAANRVTNQERRLTETASARARELTRLVSTQNAIATSHHDLDVVMGTVVDEALTLTNAEAAVVELPDGRDMVYRATAGTASPHLGLRLARDGTISGRALRERRVLSCRDSELDERVDREACRRVGARSMVVVPLLDGERAAGVLKVYSSTVDAFTPIDATLLSMLAAMVTTALVRAELLDRLEAQATTDELTGLANRREWYHRLDGALLRARRSGQPVSVVLLDVNGLKTINDRDGHAAGDRLLRSVTSRWSAALREQDVLGRIGGDEFAVVLEGAGETEAADVVERLRQALAGTQSAAAGIATWDGTEPGAELVDRADEAMYEDKRAGKSALAGG
jgi:diguanylate cyclase (GGDEF)-like protein